MENVGTNLVNNFDITKVDNKKINMIITRMRPGKSDLVKDIFRIMKKDVPFGICISPTDDLKSANLEDECIEHYDTITPSHI